MSIQESLEPVLHDALLVDTILSELQKALGQILEGFDRERLFSLILRCHTSRGTLFFTGVGKSGIAARKIVSTVTSFGKKASYLAAQDALHGDIGSIETGDIVFLLSKSGETEELLTLCPALREKGAFLVAVASNPKSRLVKVCDESFYLPSVKELCPFDIVPTTSILAQLIFGDVLSISLMRMQQVSLDEFIKNHPGGRIGRRHILKVGDLMRQEEKVPKVAPAASISDILHELSSKECGCVFIVDPDDHLLGIFTDGDLRRSLQTYGQEVFSKIVGDLMTPNPRITYAHAKANEAMRLMEQDPQHPITVLGVVDEACHLIGALKLHDVLQSGI